MKSLKIIIFTITITLIFAFTTSLSTFARKRPFVYTQTYGVKAVDVKEIGLSIDLSFSDTYALKKIRHQFKIATGIYERLDISIYQVFSQVSNYISYDQFNIRLRYGLLEKNKFFVDPLLLLEYKGVPDLSLHVIDSRIILSKTFIDDTIILALNGILEQAFKVGQATKYEGGINIGLSTVVIKNVFDIGFEFISKFSSKEPKYYIAPALSFGDKSKKLNVAYRVKIDVKPEFDLATLIEFNL